MPKKTRPWNLQTERQPYRISSPHLVNSELLDKDSRPYLRPKTGGFGYHGTEGEEGTVIAFWGSMMKRCRIPAAKLVDIVPMTLKILSIESKRKFDGENIWSCDDER